MLRTSFHLSELLQTHSKSIEAVEAPSSTPQHSFSPRRKLNPGPYQRIKVKKPEQAISQSSLGAPSTEIVDTYSAKFLYNRKLSRTDEPRVIRLLNILPGRRSDPIVCELHYVSLELPPYYEAISYCWGAQEPSVTIDCNGQPLRVTENLIAAITTLRLEDTSLLIWADAICIDQASIEEKNSQVPLMRLIYQNAALVQVWLGEDTPAKTCQEAFSLLWELNHAYNKLNGDFNIFMKHSGGESLNSCKLPALDDPSWTSLLVLAQRPWFARAWVIQEVAVSRCAILRCGSTKLYWKDFCFGFLFAVNAGFLSYQTEILQHPLAYQHLISLIITYVCFAKAIYRNFDLLSLLQSHRLAGATDPKDKVYALIGLLTKAESQVYRLIPNYSLPTAEVYTEVSKAIILKSLTLDILGVPRTASNPLIDNFPSWVTDWSVFHLASSLSLKNLQGDYIFDFNATNVHIPKQVAFRGCSLILNGHVFDTIVKVGKVMNPFTSLAVDERLKSKPSPLRTGYFLRMLHIYLVLQDWQTIHECFSSTHSYPNTSDSLLEVFCRTIFLNNMPEGYTLALAVHDYGRFTLRMAFLVVSHLCRYPVVLKFLNWYESRLIFGYALLKDMRKNVISNMIARTVGRRMVVTESGYLGLAPELVKIGHCVTIIKGGKVPLILRPIEDTKWELIGDCYIHGIMHGEGFEQQKCVEMEII